MAAGDKGYDALAQELGISELNSDEIPKIESNTAPGNSYADTQFNKTWGTALQFKDGAYRFSKEYVCFTFFVNRGSYVDFQKARKGKVSIRGTKNNIDITYPNNFGEKNSDGEIINITQADDSDSDIQMVVRATVSSRKLYNLGELTEAHCSFDYSAYDGPRVEGWVKLNNGSFKAYSQVYWFNGGRAFFGNIKDRIQKNSGYSSKKFCPWSDYSGTIEIGSKVRDTGTLEKKYFTEDKGKLVLTVDATFLHQNIKPTNIEFHCTTEAGDPKIVSVELKRDDFSNNKIEIDSSKFIDCKIINKAYIWFGKDDSNKIQVHDFSDFLNCDIPSNLSLAFSKTDNINNYYVQMSEQNKTPRSVTLKSCMKGTINFPYNLFEINSVSLKKKEENSEKKNISWVTENQNLKFTHEQTYTCVEQNNNGFYSLFFSNQPFSNGEYNLICNVKYKLKTEEETIDDYTFSVKDLKVDSKTNEEYVAFTQTKPSLKYILTNNNGTETIYGVPGTIIIPDEYLEFSGSSANNFFVYSLKDGTKKNINTIYIGFDLNRKTILNSKMTYNTLKEIFFINRSITDETCDGDLRYYFKLSGSTYAEDNVYTYSFPYTIGRVATPIYTSRKEEIDGISYYLQDCGGDIKYKTENSEGKTQNQYLQARKVPVYFSLSRQPQNGNKAQEKLKLIFSRENTSIPLEIKIRQENINIMLKFLTTFESNKITFSEVLGAMSDDELTELRGILSILKNEKREDDEKEILSRLETFLKQGKIKLQIGLYYIYGTGTLTYDRELFKIDLVDLNFAPGITPIGLRKKGVIINPKENEDLISTSTETEGKSRNNAFVINVRNVEATESEGKTTYTPTNGCRIVFDTGAEGAVKPVFEIFLDSNGEICFSNGQESFNAFETIEAFSKIKAIQKHLNLSDEQLENLLSS